LNGKTGDKKSVFHRRDSLRETLFLLSYPGLCSNVLPEEVRVEDGRQKKGCECLCLCGRGQKRRAGTRKESQKKSQNGLN